MLDSQVEQQPLLKDFGIIILPADIDDAAYVQVLWALTAARQVHSKKRLRLYCSGSGGHTSAALAIVDLIRTDGRIDGILVGGAFSSISFIWAACDRRYAYPNAGIGVHSSIFVANTWEDITFYQTVVDTTKNFDQQIARIYARASDKKAKWWLKKMNEGHSACFWLGAKKLIKLGMAKPYKGRS